MMVGSNLNDVQLQQLVDRTIIKADKDMDGKISFEEFTEMVKDLDVIDKLTINYWSYQYVHITTGQTHNASKVKWSHFE